MNVLGNEIQWEWLMNKTNSVLSVSIYDEGVKRGVKEFEIPQGLTVTRYEDGDIYFDKEEIRLIEDLLLHKMHDQGYASRIADKVLKRAKAIEDYAFDSAAHKDKSLKELAATLKEEIEAFFWMTSFMGYRGSVQMSSVIGEHVKAIVTTRLAEKKRLHELEETIHLLQEPLKSSIVWEEKYSLLKAARNPNLEQALKKHIEQFGWLAFHWFQGRLITIEEHAKRLDEVPNPATALAAMEKEREETEAKIAKTLQELSFSKNEGLLVEDYRHWIFLRTYVKDNINLAAYKLLPLLGLMGKKIGWDEQEMPWLTYDELITLHEQDVNELEKLKEVRKQSFGSTLMLGSYEIYAPAQPLKREVEGTAIKGQNAYQGLVEGVARVMKHSKESARLKKGEILVTCMTTPEFLPAMERAAAFVTDEGGITCHAAIVARELKKPCVIGTRHATTLIKDGDRIRVDAKKGIVEIIS